MDDQNKPLPLITNAEDISEATREEFTNAKGGDPDEPRHEPAD